MARKKTSLNPGVRAIILMIILAEALFTTAIVMWWMSRVNGPHWTTFTSTSGHFSVSMPGKPKEDVMTSMMMMKEVAQHQFALDRGKHGVSFVVQYTDLPFKISTSHAPADILMHMRDVAVAQAGLKVSTWKLLSQQGYPGLEFAFHHPESGNATIRYYLVKGRLYYLYTGPDTGTKSQKEMHRFLDSFRLVK